MSHHQHVCWAHTHHSSNAYPSSCFRIAFGRHDASVSSWAHAYSNSPSLPSPARRPHNRCLQHYGWRWRRLSGWRRRRCCKLQPSRFKRSLCTHAKGYCQTRIRNAEIASRLQCPEARRSHGRSRVLSIRLEQSCVRNGEGIPRQTATKQSTSVNSALYTAPNLDTVTHTHTNAHARPRNQT